MIIKKKLKEPRIEHNMNLHTPELLLSQEKSHTNPSQESYYADYISQIHKQQNFYIQPKTEQSTNVRLNEINLNEYDEQEVLKGLSKYINKLTNQSFYQINNKYHFVSTPIPPGTAIIAYLKKEAGSLKSFKKKLNPEYHLYLKSDDQHIMSAKNYPISREIFKLSLEEGRSYSRKDSEFYGTVICNTSINRFWFQCPLKRKIANKGEEQLKVIIGYSNGSPGGNQKAEKKKKMQSYVYLENKEQYLSMKNKTEDIDMEKLDENEFLILEDQQENGKDKFGKKDFALADQEGDEYQYMKMFQIGDKVYEMEIQHPLTIAQAFSIALTRFEACLN